MLRSLYVDLNSYFASVEQQVHVELRGKPVIVVPMKVDTTCALAASYEAKRYGIRTGTMVSDAKKMCPGLIVVEASHTLYVEFHHKIVEAVESVIHVDAIKSVDEMACELMGSMRQTDKAVATAKEVKRVIREKVGSEMSCSVGIAPNDFLAKAATDMQKPDGLVVIQEEDLPQALLRFKDLREFCGIGRKMYQRLWKYGIYTVEMLVEAPKEQLREVWGGIEGERFWHALRGHDVYRRPEQKTTVGHSRVLDPKLRNRPGVIGVLHRQLQKAAMRLRAYGLVTGQVHVSIRYMNNEKWRMDMNVTPTADVMQLTHVLTAILDRCDMGGRIPLKVSVSFNNLTPQEAIPQPLFEHTGPSREKLNASMDKITRKYGKNALFVGTAYNALDSAPLRIAFNHIPDIDIEDDD